MKKLLDIKHGEVAFIVCRQVLGFDNVVGRLCNLYSETDKKYYIYNPLIEGGFSSLKIRSIVRDYCCLDLILYLDVISCVFEKNDLFKRMKESAVLNDVSFITFGSPSAAIRQKPLDDIIESMGKDIRKYVDMFIDFACTEF